jgi:hypothetical protein
VDPKERILPCLSFALDAHGRNNAVLRRRAVSKSLFLKPSRMGHIPNKKSQYVAILPSSEKGISAMEY